MWLGEILIWLTKLQNGLLGAYLNSEQENSWNHFSLLYSLIQKSKWLVCVILRTLYKRHWTIIQHKNKRKLISKHVITCSEEPPPPRENWQSAVYLLIILMLSGVVWLIVVHGAWADTRKGGHRCDWDVESIPWFSHSSRFAVPRASPGSCWSFSPCLKCPQVWD